MFTTFQVDFNCCNPNLGLTTKAKACKVAGQEGSLGVRLHAPRSARECEGIDLTLPGELPRELPHWELESRWTPKCSESNCRGQNPMD